MLALARLHIEFMTGQLWLAVLACLIFLVASYFYYRRTTPPLAGPLRWLLFGLRALAFTAVFLSLAQPILSYTSSQILKKRLALLVDRSGSMKLPLGTTASRTRLDEAQDLIDGSALKALKDNLDIDYFAFAESLDAAPKGPNLSGRETNPVQALLQLRQKTLVSPYDYVLMVSDGRVTAGENLADMAGLYGRPLFTVAVGDSSRSDDISLDDVQYNDVIYAGRPTEIKGTVSQQGEIAGQIAVTLSDGKTTLTQMTVNPPGNGKSGDFTLNFTPSTPGKMILSLEAQAGSGDNNKLNNRRKFAVRVLKSKLSVLIYSSSLNQEVAFLNRFLKSRNDYEVTLVIDASGGDRFGPRFPSTQEELNRYDLVAMIDPDLSRIGDKYDKLFSYMSDRGGGICLLMGDSYAKSASGNRISNLVPFVLSNPRGEPVRYGKYHIVPDPRMVFHPALKLAETREDITALWANEPPFAMYVPIDSVPSNGAVLGYIDGDSDRGKHPAMAYRRFGPGKLLAVAVSPFWHWAFYPIGVGGNASHYQDFFSAVIRWLTVSDESDRINFKPDKEVFQSGDRIVFSGMAHDEGFRPIDNAGGDLVIYSEKGDSTVARILPEAGKPGAYRAEVGTLAPGSYTYRAVLMAENVRLGQFDGKFAVDDIDRETAFGAVDWTGLQQAAKNSGGAFASYRDLKPIIDGINTDRRTVSESHEVRLWDNWVLLLVIILALSVEWFLRKQRQLL